MPEENALMKTMEPEESPCPCCRKQGCHCGAPAVDDGCCCGIECRCGENCLCPPECGCPSAKTPQP